MRLPQPSPLELSWGREWRSEADSARLAANVDYCWRFFVGQVEAQQAAEKLVAILERE